MRKGSFLPSLGKTSIAVVAALLAVIVVWPTLPVDAFYFVWAPPDWRVKWNLLGMTIVWALAYIYFSTVKEPEDWPRLIREKTRVTKALIKEYVLWQKPLEEEEEGSGREEQNKEAGGGTVKKDEEDGEEEVDEDSDGIDEKTKRKPPTGKELFKLVWDEIENKPVTELGVARDENYQKVWDLFKERLRADIEKAQKLTKLARDIDEGESEWNDKTKAQTKVFETDEELNLQLLKEFEDGNKLQDLVSFVRNEVERAFGKDKAIPEKFIRGVEQFIKYEIGSVTWRNSAPVLNILKPLIPIWVLAMMALCLESSVSHLVWHGMQLVLDGLLDGQRGSEEITREIKAVLVKLFFVRVMDWTGCQLFNRVRNQFRLDIQNAVMSSITKQDTEFFDFNTTGILQERLGRDVHGIANNFLRVFRDSLRIMCHVCGIMWVCWQIDVEIFLYALLPVPFIVMAQRLLIKYMQKVSERMTKMNEKTATTNAELLKNIRTVREFVMEREETQNYFTWNERKREICEARDVINSGCWSMIWMSFCLMRLFCFKLGGEKMLQEKLSYGQVLQITGGFMAIMHCMRHLSVVIPDAIKMLRPMGRICALLKAKPRIEHTPGRQYRCSTKDIKGTVEFKDVHFTYPSEPQKPILQGLSFKAGVGEKVAFVGATGCGKSTAVQIIESFYRVQSGQVLIDGEPIEDYRTEDLRKVMSIVAQDNIMFSTTIRENILYGLPQAEREKISNLDIIECCKQANAWKFINEFPRKLETFVGERGQKLSGGQKQRLAIARAIIRQPTILLLDEATSALDAKAEKLVQGALNRMIEENKQGCTLIIAHRLTTIRNCDRIVVMDKGKCVEQGPHEELMAIPVKKDADGKMISGYYHDLWDTQMRSDKSEDSLKTVKTKLKFAEERNEHLEDLVAELRCELLAARGAGKWKHQHEYDADPCDGSGKSKKSESSDGEKRTFILKTPPGDGSRPSKSYALALTMPTMRRAKTAA